MTEEELRKLLCYYDLRNPIGVTDLGGNLVDDWAYEEEEVKLFGNHAKKDCGCDNCFYGRHRLANFTLELLNKE